MAELSDVVNSLREKIDSLGTLFPGVMGHFTAFSQQVHADSSNINDGDLLQSYKSAMLAYNGGLAEPFRQYGGVQNEPDNQFFQQGKTKSNELIGHLDNALKVSHEIDRERALDTYTTLASQVFTINGWLLNEITSLVRARDNPLDFLMDEIKAMNFSNGDLGLDVYDLLSSQPNLTNQALRIGMEGGPNLFIDNLNTGLGIHYLLNGDLHNASSQLKEVKSENARNVSGNINAAYRILRPTMRIIKLAQEFEKSQAIYTH
jgi:hypothetical protein